jgi:cytochrome c biogenesis protein CcmG/thiol:disulfide interchange protein DsbE
MKPISPLPKALRLALPICVLVGMALSLMPLQLRSQMPVIRFVRDPDPAPGFNVKDLDGKDLSLETLKGKVVLLNFWATWCGPCRAEIPSLIELQNRYNDHMQIVGMVVDDDDENAIRDVVKTESINYPVALAPPQVRMDYGGIAALPTVFIINTDGRVVQKHVGLFNPGLYETEVRALLGLPINARVETFEDTGEIFLKHADRASMLPGVNMIHLTPEQRTVALHKLNAETCTCGCKFTLAQCRIYDPACGISTARAAAIIKELSAAKPKEGPKAPPDSPRENDSSAPAQPPPSQHLASHQNWTITVRRRITRRTTTLSF